MIIRFYCSWCADQYSQRFLLEDVLTTLEQFLFVEQPHRTKMSADLVWMVTRNNSAYIKSKKRHYLHPGPIVRVPLCFAPRACAAVYALAHSP